MALNFETLVVEERKMDYIQASFGWFSARTSNNKINEKEKDRNRKENKTWDKVLFDSPCDYRQLLYVVKIILYRMT